MLEVREHRTGARPGDAYVRIVRPFEEEFEHGDEGQLIASEQTIDSKTTFGRWFRNGRNFLFGRPISSEHEEHERLTKVKALAVFSSDNISSSAYATAKGGIIALTRKLAFELGPHGITVNAIAPSLTLSERIRPHWERRSAEAQAAEIKRTPLGRVATPEDQARVICFLASSDADFVTGVTIDVTGGQ